MLLLSKEAESGDKEQVFFETLYQRYSRLLYSKAKQYSNSEDDAEDISVYTRCAEIPEDVLNGSRSL